VLAIVLLFIAFEFHLGGTGRDGEKAVQADGIEAAIVVAAMRK
jgi:hypothetical protein